jgi:SDR family mycofactocin-dependent oxidoreductase
MGRLDGRVALITGGARGQGRAIAAKFASEGADIVIGDVCAQLPSVPYPMSTTDDLQETADLVDRAGRQCIAEVVDVRDQAALTGLAERAVGELGRIDVLCANAGIVNFAPFWELTEEAWDEMLAVNLTGVWKSVRAVAPHMMERRSGSIILTSSVNGREAGPEMTHYVAAKHGVIGLLRSFAYELGPFGVRVNAVLPGPILSPMANNEATRSWIFRRAGATLEDYLQATRNWHLLRGRPSLPTSVIADAMIWLASDEAAQVTGVELPVDAGHMVLPGMNMDPIVDDELGTFDYEGTALSAVLSGKDSV